MSITSSPPSFYSTINCNPERLFLLVVVLCCLLFQISIASLSLTPIDSNENSAQTTNNPTSQQSDRVKEQQRELIEWKYLEIAEASMERGDFETALYAVRREKEKRGESEEVVEKLVVCLRQLGRDSEAEHWSSVYNRIVQGNYDAKEHDAQACASWLSNNEWKLTSAWIRSMKDLTSKVSLLLPRFLLQMNEIEFGCLMNRSCPLDRQTIESYTTQAHIYSDLGRYQKSMDIFHEAARIFTRFICPY